MDYSQQQRTDHENVGSGGRTHGQSLCGGNRKEQPAQAGESIAPYLDLFSTSQTNSKKQSGKRKVRERAIYDECKNNAPFFAYHIEGKKFGIVQGCCNDWNCPRCGQQRAKEEYGRIVAGSRQISQEHQLYLFTITCRGKECSLDDAEQHYLEWTNRLLTRLRTAQKRSGGQWYYACVTERQKRGHPHSHLLTTYCPPDTQLVPKGGQKYFYTTSEWFQAKHETLQSEVVERACAECGLGYQYDLSRLESVEAGSRYVAKYLFKADIFETVWPKGWRRIRYSQNWPKLPDKESEAFVLLKREDWLKLARMALVVKTLDDYAKKRANQELRFADVIVQ